MRINELAAGPCSRERLARVVVGLTSPSRTLGRPRRESPIEPLQRARHECQRGRSRVVGSGGAGSRMTGPR